MRKEAWVGIVVLVGALSAYLLSGSAMADKSSRNMTDGDIGTESAIYGPMTVRAVPKAPRPADPAVREEKCFECHDEIEALKKGRKAREGQLHELSRRDGGPPEGQRRRGPRRASTSRRAAAATRTSTRASRP